MTNEELDAHTVHMFAQVLEEQNEVAVATEAVTVIEKAQGVNIQADFKVFRQLLL